MVRTIAVPLFILLAHGCGLLLDADQGFADQMDGSGIDGSIVDGGTMDGDGTMGDGAAGDGMADGSSFDAGRPDSVATDGGSTTNVCGVVGAPCMRAGRPGLCAASGLCEVLTCTPGTPCQVGCATGVLSCPGGAPTCIADNIAARGTICRGTLDILCDTPERCDGSDGVCPPDVHAADGDMCSTCGGSFACNAGRCVPTSPEPEQGTCRPGEFCCAFACQSSECF